MSRVEDHSPAAPLSVTVMIVGRDREARARTRASLEAQSMPVRILESGSSIDAVSGESVMLVAAGAELHVTACERLHWLLATNPTTRWVTGRPDGSPPSPVSALLQLFAARRADVCAAVSTEIWREAAHDGTRTPGLALRLALALNAGEARGVMMVQPVLRSTNVDLESLVRAADTLAYLEVEESTLLDAAGIEVPTAPIQGAHQALPGTHAAAPLGDHDARMRLLFLLQGFPMGGYTAFNADVIPRFVSAGHHVTIATTETWYTDWRLERVLPHAPDVHHLPSVVPPSFTLAYLTHLIRTRHIDVLVVSHSLVGYHLLPLLRTEFPQLAIVDYVHTEWFETHMYGSYATLSAQATAVIDQHLLSSRALCEAQLAKGVPGNRLLPVHIGIDTEAWTSDGADGSGVRAALGVSDTTTVLLFAGRVSPEKRPLLAVDALAALRAEGIDVHLVVAGSGPQLAAVQAALAAQSLTAHATVVGEVDDTVLRQLYAATDVYFAPSEVEGVARTLYEAMAMGCIPVVSDVGGQRELVAGTPGFVVDPEGTTVTPYLPALRSACAANRHALAPIIRHVMVERFDAAHTVSGFLAACTRALAVRAANPHEPPVDRGLATLLATSGLEIMRRHVLSVAASAA